LPLKHDKHAGVCTSISRVWKSETRTNIIFAVCLYIRCSTRRNDRVKICSSQRGWRDILHLPCTQNSFHVKTMRKTLKYIATTIILPSSHISPERTINYLNGKYISFVFNHFNAMCISVHMCKDMCLFVCVCESTCLQYRMTALIEGRSCRKSRDW